MKMKRREREKERERAEKRRKNGYEKWRKTYSNKLIRRGRMRETEWMWVRSAICKLS